MAKVFFSYSHEDEALRDRLEKHLALLQRQGLVNAWHDRRILAGSELDQAISMHLEDADVVLLLVSASFLASDYCYSQEMTRAMERHLSGSAVVIPVIIGPCDWHTAPFGKLLAAPRDGKPVALWANHDEAFADVAVRVRKVVERLPGQAADAAAPSTSIPATRVTRPTGSARSSNLRLKKEFTQRDRDVFLHDSFEYVARFFESSLEELQSRNPGIEASYRRIDADTFTATIYRQGKNVSQCAIRLGGFSGHGITYSSDVSSRGNSYNEMLSVEADGQGLFLHSMGMDFAQRGEHMSHEGAAEFLWAMLIRPLQ